MTQAVYKYNVYITKNGNIGDIIVTRDRTAPIDRNSLGPNEGPTASILRP